MHSAVFDFEGVRVKATLPHADQLLWLHEFLSPSFAIDTDDRCDAEITVVMDDHEFEQRLRMGAAGRDIAAFVFDSRVVRLPLWNDDANRTVFYDQPFQVLYEVLEPHSVFRIVTPENNHLLVRTPVMRAIREFVMSTLRGAQGLFLHSSAFVANGKAAIIAGPTTAGKSTTLIYMLEHGEHDYLANDRSFLRKSGDGYVARGMPTVVTIRQSTLDVLPSVSSTLLEQGYNFRMNSRESAARGTFPQGPRPGGEFGLNPYQYCQWLETTPVSTAPVSALICPRQTGKPGTIEIETLSVDDSVELLKHAVFGLGDWNAVSEVFVPKEFESIPTGDELEQLCRECADTVPCYLCGLGLDSLQNREMGDKIDRLLS